MNHEETNEHSDCLSLSSNEISVGSNGHGGKDHSSKSKFSTGDSSDLSMKSRKIRGYIFWADRRELP